jgi:hypothetical protein
MPESIDWPPTHPRAHPPRRRRRFLLILGVLAGIVFGGRTALSNYVDLLWFRSLGYGDVFWKTLSLQCRLQRFTSAGSLCDQPSGAS